jgi:hypothetical protein
MIITAPASTIRSAAKRAGYDKAIAIRTGSAANRKECEHVQDNECSVLIHTGTPGVEEFLDWLSNRYGFRYQRAR